MQAGIHPTDISSTFRFLFPFDHTGLIFRRRVGRIEGLESITDYVSPQSIFASFEDR